MPAKNKGTKNKICFYMLNYFLVYILIIKFPPYLIQIWKKAS
jgi:hypothetical protein